ncbi:MAG: 5'/3'-nucleotidase SurE [Gemmatimonadota bacterium]|nr:5'/3'-nucleotidase SurE [Gemmatimonadota bacterium]
MRFLIANDDGVYSPGLAALAEVASRFGEVRIVAPDVEQSSMGHAITHSRPLAFRRTPLLKKFDAYRVNGTPADCVALGTFLWKQVDVVLSGINLGPNIGNGIFHSGTLAAAKQAALLGLRGIALSTPTGKTEPDFARLDPWVERVLELLLPESSLRLVNVNFPPDPRGVCWTRVSVRQYDGRVATMADPQGREVYWLTVHPIEETERGTDRWALQRDHVSITPLQLDLTDHELLDDVRERVQLDEPQFPEARRAISVMGDGGASDAAAEEEEAESEASAG